MVPGRRSHVRAGRPGGIRLCRNKARLSGIRGGSSPFFAPRPPIGALAHTPHGRAVRNEYPLALTPPSFPRRRSSSSSSRYSVLQPSVCAGSEIHHPTLKQRPGVGIKIVPMYTVELQARYDGPVPRADPAPLVAVWQTVFGQGPSPAHLRPCPLQMPFGRSSWWEIIKESYLRKQVFGFGVDLVWTQPVGHERSTGVVNAGACCASRLGLAAPAFPQRRLRPWAARTVQCACSLAAPLAAEEAPPPVSRFQPHRLAVCATHPYRKDAKHHVSGLGEGLLEGLTRDSLWAEYRKNKVRAHGPSTVWGSLESPGLTAKCSVAAAPLSTRDCLSSAW